MHSPVNLTTVPDEDTSATLELQTFRNRQEGRQASLTVVQPDSSQPCVRLLTGRPTKLGRKVGRHDFEIPGERVSRHHATVRFVAAADAYCIEDQNSTNGTWVDGERVDRAFLSHGSVIRLGTTLLAFSRVELPGNLTSVPVAPSPSWSTSLALADRAARSNVPILIQGPTGAGKEVAAQRIHDRSGRSGPFVPVNCGGLAPDLIASELFGHTAGAYTGAQTARDGLFAAADGGTLFLDEIAELPLALQPFLLRALQQGAVRAIGSNDYRPVDVRVIAATHQDLPTEIREGRFREDLYARLAGLELSIGGLKERREEILRLLRLYLPELGGPIETEAAEALLLHDWPQNVREIQRVAHHARLFLDGATSLGANLLPPSLRRPPREPSDTPPTRASLQALMDTHDGNIAHVARVLGRHRQQVYRWLDRYAIERPA